MNSSKLILLLSTFSTKERFHFRKYLASPYHNEDKDLSLLFGFIEQNVIGKSKIPSQEEVIRELFSEDSMTVKQLRLKMSYLLKQAEHFLVVHSLEEKEMDYEIKLGNILNERKLLKHYKASDRKMQQWLDDEKNKGTQYSHYNFQYQLLKRNHIRGLSSRTINNNFSALHQSLDVYYIQEKLRHYFGALNFRSVRNVEIDVGISALILNVVKESDYLKIPAINIYYHAYLLLEYSDDENNFIQLRELLKNNYNQFLFNEIFDLYTLLQNFCIQQVNAGKSEYLDSLMEVYEDIMNVELFSEENNITPWFYKNIITAGLLSSKFDWISRFIEKHTVLLPESERENAYFYNLANLHFYKEEYSETIDILNQVTFTDVVYELDGRWLLIRAYYELDEFSSLDSLLSSFRLYLLRNKLITSSRKKQYLNLIRYVQKIIKMMPSEKNKINKLKNKLSQEKNMPTKKWLLDKLSEMINE